ncbi:MAG: uroporphyrinogen decarboxylase family protein [Clostridia bacterium]
MNQNELAQFWKDDAMAHQDNCFFVQAPQVALGIGMSDECVFAELGEEGKPWGHTDQARRIELNQRYNDKAERIVGKRLLREEFTPLDAKLPDCKGIGEVFGGEYIFDGNTTWLEGHCKDEKDLELMLNRIDRMDLREFILPPNWEAEKKRVFETYGTMPNQYCAVRGPVTLATSIFGIENLIYLMYDAPELAQRFSQTIQTVILEYVNIFIAESGKTRDTFDHGFWFADDDCNLLTPEMYEQFGLPVLKSVFDFCAPNPEDHRFQHSDSAMGHLLPLLATLNLSGCNFGPTVSVTDIRKHMPRTRIDGQIAPFTFMRNNAADILAEVKRDCMQAKESGVKGLNLATAGSINNGSLLSSMLVVMEGIQTYGRY